MKQGSRPAVGSLPLFLIPRFWLILSQLYFFSRRHKAEVLPLLPELDPGS